MELILSQHDCLCATCVRSGSCQLQRLANSLGIISLPYERELPKGARGAWTTTYPLYRDYQKCIKCMRCIQVCDKIQDLHIWDVTSTGSRTTINVTGNHKISEVSCSLCGQCITHCPAALCANVMIQRKYGMQSLMTESRCCTGCSCCTCCMG